MSNITINGVTLNPAAETPALKQLALFQPDAASSDYILVQTREPLTAPQKKQLSDTGAEMLEYVPTNTYICRYNDTDLHQVRALPFVAWANVYLEGFKISPQLHAAVKAKQAPLLGMQGMASSPGSSLEQVDIVLHRDADRTAALNQVALAAGVSPGQLNADNGKIRLRVDTDRLDALSKIDLVRNIEPVFEKKLWNNVARGILGADTVMTALGLQGQGQIVAVCDTGFDNGDAGHPHPAFEGRVKALHALGRPNDASDPQGHGTHVCGSVLGDGHSADGPIRGTAPKATLVMQSVLDARGGLGGLGNNLYRLFQQAYDEGARVHSNSWGDSNNGYTPDAYDVDNFIWTNRDMSILFAAGNDGSDRNRDGLIDAHSVGSPGTAKNCITVGASENQRPDFYYVDGRFKFNRYGQGWPQDYPSDPLRNDKLADNPEGLAAFSSRGPTADGRIKPDLVAPGTGILSTRSRADGVANGWGPSPDPLYFYEGGTSMATPLVSGCAAVVREFLQSQQAARPSAAIVKAILINAARPLLGQYTPSEAGTIPNNNQGFGRVNLAAAVDAGADSEILAWWDEGTQLDTGDEEVFTVQLDRPAAELKVTLVWTDPPGETLQNDLDLTVETDSGRLGIGNAAPGSTIPDRSNNVEQVSLLSVPAGAVTIKVKAYRIAIDRQSFALVARAVL
ncbi:S8 family serine peptidase [Janthinobacterium agaricidamnosum]|uniref:Protease n=1 Tax=Janthinobacterium agaricidamnosum NBRC 102515 = DSM 9628 TaxID=1349767 RepID=W0V3E7_9BURK|nr:S8 family serine peptidase [Janthinobacterium agaricidamnosum]CDG83354.1 protease [Janthinobacterium agaricidamnosum NBRC 102515 = DSM 9628]